MSKAKTYVFYHDNCIDGTMAAWAAWKGLGGNCHVIAMTYDKMYQLPDIRDTFVYFVDITPSFERYAEQLKEASLVVVLDHHKGAQEDYNRLSELPNFTGIFDTERSGAGLAWDYFNPGVQRPTVIDCTEDRDLWLFKRSITKSLMAALMARNYHAQSFEKIKDSLNGLIEDTIEDDEKVRELVVSGIALNAQHQNIARNIIARSARYFITAPGVIGGVSRPHVSDKKEGDDSKYIAFVPCPREFSSEVADQILKFTHVDLVLTYEDLADRAIRQFSLRSRGEEALLVAKVFGGGGHPKASGMRVGIPSNGFEYINDDDVVDESIRGDDVWIYNLTNKLIK